MSKQSESNCHILLLGATVNWRVFLPPIKYDKSVNNVGLSYTSHVQALFFLLYTQQTLTRNWLLINSSMGNFLTTSEQLTFLKGRGHCIGSSKVCSNLMDSAVQFAGCLVSAMYRVIQEERAVFGEVTLWAIVRKITSYDHGYTGGADKSLAWAGRTQSTATEDFDVHISYL